MDTKNDTSKYLDENFPLYPVSFSSPPYAFSLPFKSIRILFSWSRTTNRQEESYYFHDINMKKDGILIKMFDKIIFYLKKDMKTIFVGDII